MTSKKVFSNSKIYKIEPMVDHEKGIFTLVQQLSYICAQGWQLIGVVTDAVSKENKTVQGLFDKHGVENCSISLLKKFPCNTQDELFAKESEFKNALTNPYQAVMKKSKNARLRIIQIECIHEL